MKRDLIETIIREFYGMERVEGAAFADGMVRMRCRGCMKEVTFPILSIDSDAAAIASIENAGRGHEKCAEKRALRERGKKVVAALDAPLRPLSSPVVVAISWPDYEAVREYLLAMSQIRSDAEPLGMDAGTFYQLASGEPRHEVVGAWTLREGEVAIGGIARLEKPK